MESQSINGVSGPQAAPSGARAPAQPSPQSTSAAGKAVAEAAEAQREQAEAARAEKVPQRDPRSLQYQVDGATHRIVATIVDESSKTVVRQIPDEEIVRIAKAIDRMQGFLVEDKA